MMLKLESTIVSALASTPALVLEQILRPKLKASGVKSWRAGAKALATHLVKRDGSEFNWEDPAAPGTDHKISIEFTDDDIRKLERVADSYADGTLEEIAKSVLESTADKVLERYTVEWYQHRRVHERHVQMFRSDIEDRWGIALDQLRLLHDLCSDEGEKFQRRALKRGKKGRGARTNALLKLHARACQVSAEAICLLENGYANGAMARWRTLYEIEVTATVLADGSNLLSTRYLDALFRIYKDIWRRQFISTGRASLPRMVGPPPWLAIRHLDSIRLRRELTAYVYEAVTRPRVTTYTRRLRPLVTT